MNLSPEKKIAGILAPLFGLRSENDLGIGDVAVLREFIDWASEIGFKLVQLLPIDEMGGDNSPYNALSSLAIEPATIAVSPQQVPDLTEEEFHKMAEPPLLAATTLLAATFLTDDRNACMLGL